MCVYIIGVETHNNKKYVHRVWVIAAVILMTKVLVRMACRGVVYMFSKILLPLWILFVKHWVKKEKKLTKWKKKKRRKEETRRWQMECRSWFKVYTASYSKCCERPVLLFKILFCYARDLAKLPRLITAGIIYAIVSACVLNGMLPSATVLLYIAIIPILFKVQL